jgi:hypothetical protein
MAAVAKVEITMLLVVVVVILAAEAVLVGTAEFLEQVAEAV